ncbi:DUF4386 domain-containing protein [Caulobacter sp. KR2-114]|uniref:DUF4386 domain-containing protein n=1 Tax=Caulobacter sp. KR2-114 TaxID=3400912 RepID=UPI003C05EF02
MNIDRNGIGSGHGHSAQARRWGMSATDLGLGSAKDHARLAQVATGHVSGPDPGGSAPGPPSATSSSGTGVIAPQEAVVEARPRLEVTNDSFAGLNAAVQNPNAVQWRSGKDVIAPKAQARVAGVLYLVVIACGLFAELFVRERLVISTDAAATAHNLMSAQGLYRAGLVADLLMVVCDLALAVILYALLKPAGRTLALFALVIRVVPDAVLAVKALLALAPLLILRGDATLAPFSTAQLQSAALLALKFHDMLYVVAMTLFGVNLIVLGALVFKSGYYPRALGLLLVMGGLCGFAANGAALAMPGLSTALPSFVSMGPLVAEVALTLWLVIFGLDLKAWKEQASRAV